MSPIHDQSYRHYEGERRPLGRAWTVITWTGMRSLLSRKWFIAVLALPLSHLVGEEFELVYEVNASAEFSASAHGALSFAELPTGYGVASCQGFAGDGAVSIRRASWGALKLHYR